MDGTILSGSLVGSLQFHIHASSAQSTPDILFVPLQKYRYCSWFLWIISISSGRCLNRSLWIPSGPDSQDCAFIHGQLRHCTGYQHVNSLPTILCIPVFRAAIDTQMVYYSALFIKRVIIHVILPSRYHVITLSDGHMQNDYFYVEKYNVWKLNLRGTQRNINLAHGGLPFYHSRRMLYFRRDVWTSTQPNFILWSWFPPVPNNNGLWCVIRIPLIEYESSFQSCYNSVTWIHL